MGVSIYIKKSAVNVLSTERELIHQGCRCGDIDSGTGYCPECGFDAEDVYETYCTVEGLSVIMEDFHDTVMHVANVWGRNRQPILDFIRTKGIADDDWYEG